MTQQILDLHVSRSDETIHLGPLEVHFLITGEDSSGSIAVFEGTVPGGQCLAAGNRQLFVRAAHGGEL